MLVAASKAHPGLAAYAVAKARKDGGHVASLSTSTIEKQLGSLVRRLGGWLHASNVYLLEGSSRGSKPVFAVSSSLGCLVRRVALCKGGYSAVVWPYTV
jgi:hypothetical protein